VREKDFTYRIIFVEPAWESMI